MRFPWLIKGDKASKERSRSPAFLHILGSPAGSNKILLYEEKLHQI
ncbi:MAG: hypothetical protein F6J93_12190 [Oscillatoria sp. SIO1A7]|nr:hypothetical protein [Oscillatoria sp. SIO1A7]